MFTMVHDMEDHFFCYRRKCGKTTTATSRSVPQPGLKIWVCVVVVVGGGSGLNKLNVVGGEHSKVSVWTIASPPAFVDHLDPGDDLIWVEGDLCVVSWRKGAAAQEQW